MIRFDTNDGKRLEDPPEFAAPALDGWSSVTTAVLVTNFVCVSAIMA